MSTVPTPKAGHHDAGPSTAPRLKLVIRRLPPTLPEDLFWKTVEPWIHDKTCAWKRYVQGNTADKRLDAHAVHSRAYVLMNSPSSLVEFTRHFAGHTFRSKQGAEYHAVVEFAPMQKTPHRAKVKPDARQGTIDDDADYLAFLEQENAPPEKPVVQVSQPVEQPTTTPLLEHLRQIAKSGKGAKKSKSKPSMSSMEDSRREAALTSINKAAKKRMPGGQNGAGMPGETAMKAGKGREVVVMAGPAAGEIKEGTGRKRNRGKKKAEGADAGAAAGSVAPATKATPSTTGAVTAAKQSQRLGPAHSTSMPPVITEPGTTSGPDTSATIEAGSGRGAARRGRGRADRGAGASGSSTGRGGAPSGGRTAHGAVMQILADNAAGAPVRGVRGGGRGRGGGGGRGGAGAGRGGSAPIGGAASGARIDA